MLIHADPGARSGFIAAWLQDNLSNAGFDVGATVRPSFLKIHNLSNNSIIKSYPGTTIRIKPTFNLLNLQLLLFLRKNVHTQITNFTKDEFSLETLSKVYIFAKECFESEKQIDYSLYEYTLTFDDTFNIDQLVELYYKYNKRYPTQTQINLAIENNTINQIILDPNHACNIAAFILEKEQSLNLKEQDRLWSLPIIYETTSVDCLFSTIQATIKPENYNIPR